MRESKYVSIVSMTAQVQTLKPTGRKVPRRVTHLAMGRHWPTPISPRDCTVAWRTANRCFLRTVKVALTACCVVADRLCEDEEQLPHRNGSAYVSIFPAIWSPHVGRMGIGLR